MATPIPANSAFFRGAELCELLAQPLPQGLSQHSEVHGVVTDSRGDLNGKLFVALSGERFDGHDYLQAAAAAGAVAAVTERDCRGAEALPIFQVPSTLSALGSLGSAVRRRVSPTVIAVAGSAGKTTTRTLISHLLEVIAPGQVLHTPGNLNNRVGVPSVLLTLRPEHRYAVLELGTNLPGEVEILAEMTRPDVCVLTLVDLEHTEGLGDLDGVQREEAAIFSQGPATALGNGEDPRVVACIEQARGRRLLYGAESGCDYLIESATLLGAQGQRVQGRGPHGSFQFELPFLGHPGALAAVGAIAVVEGALGLPLSEEQLAQAFAQRVSNSRLVAIELARNVLVVDDTYNANPASMRAALRTAQDLRQQRGGSLHAVLGEMGELGDLSQQAHQEIGRLAQGMGLGSLVAIGEDARFFLGDGETNFGVASAEDVWPILRQRLSPGDTVLVKASRSVRAEQVVKALVDDLGLAERGAKE